MLVTSACPRFSPSTHSETQGPHPTVHPQSLWDAVDLNDIFPIAFSSHVHIIGSTYYMWERQRTPNRQMHSDERHIRHTPKAEKYGEYLEINKRKMRIMRHIE